MEEVKKPDEEKSIRELITEIKGNQEELKKKKEIKPWRLPWKARVGKAKLKKNWVGVLELNENKSLNPYKVKIDEGIIENANGVPHIATAEYIWYWKKKPVIIVPNWSTEPVSGKALMDKAVREQTLSVGRKLLKNHLERGQLETPKKKFGAAPIIIILVLAAIGYFIYKSGAFG